MPLHMVKGTTEVVSVEPSGEGVRVDSGLHEGAEVTSDYDPLLAKVIAWAPTRDEALASLSAALAGAIFYVLAALTRRMLRDRAAA